MYVRRWNHFFALMCFIAICVPDITKAQCRTLMAWHHTKGIALDGHVVVAYRVEKREHCESYCMSHAQQCRSFNYQMEVAASDTKHLCEISSSSIFQNKTETAKKRPGWLYQEVLDSNARIGHYFDECVSNPCQDKGTCFDGYGSYKCICQFGYNGTNCEDDYLIANAPSLGAYYGGTLPDSSFTASSQESDSKAAKNGRLNGPGYGWRPKNKDNHNEFLQIDLRNLSWICGVATESRQLIAFFERYKLSFSLTTMIWNIYQSNGSDMEFDVFKKIALRRAVKARYIRFLPFFRYGSYGLKVDVFGWNAN